MTPATTYLGHRFAAYADDWAAVGPDVPCQELEERLAYGLALFAMTIDKAEAIRAKLKATGAAYDLPAAKEVEQLWLQWLAPAPAAAAAIAAVEARGCRVERAAAFREKVDDARDFTSIPVERAAEESERRAREGLGRNSRTTEDLLRELHDRMEREGMAVGVGLAG